MTRQLLIVIGAVLLSIVGLGLIVGLVWLAAAKALGTLPPVLDARFETLLFVLPALLLIVAIAGASCIARALTAPPTKFRSERNLNLHRKLHA